nr:hypothetical protein [Helicobacter fennelliae]
MLFFVNKQEIGHYVALSKAPHACLAGCGLCALVLNSHHLQAL